MNVEYFKTLKNALSGGRYVVTGALKGVVTLLGVVIFSSTAINFPMVVSSAQMFVTTSKSV